MQVKLRVLEGKSAGMEVPIPGTKFLIGRGDDCQLRPKSDSISRRHCALLVRDSKLYIRDLKSRNGTYVNEERIEAEQQLNPGDQIRIGRLAFEVCIEYGLGGAKKPAVKDVKEAAVRAVSSANASDSTSIEMDITSWLEEADQIDRVRKLAEPETRQFKLDETVAVPLTEPGDETVKEEVEASGDDEKKKKKKEFGKLPPRPHIETNDSREAAAAMLKKFFSGR
ncbi:MAG: FHA domain-containing protein [Planctomycetales bacterium]|nr:FHA domain-containing protein [Planctomycetales bacterium]MCA9162717.1 FHA domain-containing protein [Planctomycetales bacterium]MCA9219437.1 FHA domain-containing protein [Planctomycetales bacterium]MCA9225607.1 FHA domain-containing protein [Planctomycetales bacterium]